VPLAHRLTHETMAQMVGASRPHTSTVLRDLERDGAVQRRTSSGLLVRPLRLRQIVENGCFSKTAPTGLLALSA
jgi:DNA-binding GntR family transcriptional regulator